MYTEEVKQHFKDPQNIGKIDGADAVGEVGNIACGDVMKLYIKVEINEQGERIIQDIKFETFGCVAAIATSSMITDLAKGKTIEAAIELDKDAIIEQLGGLPPIKVHCSVLAIDALSEAIYYYLKNNNYDIPENIIEKHERNQKAKDTIHERYGDWVENEEEMLK